jgi:hypothetical protein
MCTYVSQKNTKIYGTLIQTIPPLPTCFHEVLIKLQSKFSFVRTNEVRVNGKDLVYSEDTVNR